MAQPQTLYAKRYVKRENIQNILEAAGHLYALHRKASAKDLFLQAHAMEPDLCFALIREAASDGRAVSALLGVELARDTLAARDATQFLIEVWDSFVAGSQGRDHLIDPAFVALRLARIAADHAFADNAPAQCDMAYVLALSLPQDATGYAHRTHALVKALMAHDVAVTCLTRPGFPWYRGVQEQPGDCQFDGVTYHRTGDPTFLQPVTVADFLRAEEAMLHAIRRSRPRVVMAASNYQTALPALFAARRIGLPFLYEMRGFWELSKAVKDPGYSNTDDFRKEAGLEAATALAADQVFALSATIRAEVERRGVPGDKISVLPNAASLTRLHPLSKDQGVMARLGISEQSVVIGYVGSFAKYEGLDVLVHACADLARSGVDFTLVIAGCDPRGENLIGPALVDLAQTLGIAGRLRMLGQLSRAEVPTIYSIIDIAPIPRKDFPVTRLVTPLKVIEAMAMGKAVVVSDLPPLQEVVGEGAACTFPAGDPLALSRILSDLCASPDRREALGRAARQRIEANYSWPDRAAAFWKQVTTSLDLVEYGRAAHPEQVDVAGQVDYHRSDILPE